MLETPHVAVAAAIAAKIPNPFISLPLALASHFLLERVPHWNPHLNTEMKQYGKLTDKTKLIIAIDGFFALTLASIVAYSTLPDIKLALTVLASSFASILPDLLEGPYFFLGVKNKFLTWWLKSQKAIQVDASPFWGILTQIIVLTSTLVWIFN